MHRTGADNADSTTGFGHRRRTRVAAILLRERGASVVELALILPLLSFLLMAVIDLGRAYYMKIEVSNAAYTGALYGSQNSTNTTGMQDAATADAPDVSGIGATASYGCECSNVTDTTVCPASLSDSCAGPTCSVNAVNFVLVCTSATYKPIIPWPGLPATITLRGSAKMRAGQ